MGLQFHAVSFPLLLCKRQASATGANACTKERLSAVESVVFRSIKCMLHFRLAVRDWGEKDHFAFHIHFKQMVTIQINRCLHLD